MVEGQRVDEIDRFVRGQRVPFGHDQREAVVSIRKALQLARAAGDVAHAEVGRALLHRADHFAAQVLLEVDLDGLVRAREHAQVFRQELHDGRDVGVHPHVAAHAVGVFAELALHLLEAVEHRAGVVQQAFAGRREVDAARMAVEQGGAERGLQVGQPLAHGRGRDELALRRAPDAAQLAHGHEQLQRREVDAAGEVAFGRAHGGLGIAFGDELAIFFLF
ncbi:hypothetical protein D9M68_663370 [compost metagenome]